MWIDALQLIGLVLGVGALGTFVGAGIGHYQGLTAAQKEARREQQ